MVAALAPLEVRTPDDAREELKRCAASFIYFVNHYVMIYDPQAADWIPFDLWPLQVDVARAFHTKRFVAVLKARQIGLSWLALAYGLWLMLFRPIATILIFSRRDDEARYLLGHERMKGMYSNLPEWMKAAYIDVDSGHQFKLSNGSIAYAFPTTAGDSYSATLVIVDEADLVPDLGRLLRASKPTIDAGGKLFLISRADKNAPHSMFKAIYRGGKAGTNDYTSIFLPWHARPDRTQAWYEAQVRDSISRTGGLDDVHEQYPETDAQALAAASLNKRIPLHWVEQCFVEQAPIPDDDLPSGAPAIPGLAVFRLPEKGRKYVAGMDCAEGLPTSDDSATTWIDRETGEEVANLVGKLTPAMHAAYTARICAWYNNAKLLPEENNHGHAAILWLQDNGHKRLLLRGHNKKVGWTSSTLGKALMYDRGAEACRNTETLIHDPATRDQLISIEKSTLRAPDGEMDDRADSFVLALVAATLPGGEERVGMMQGVARY